MIVQCKQGEIAECRVIETVADSVHTHGCLT